MKISNSIMLAISLAFAFQVCTFAADYDTSSEPRIFNAGFLSDRMFMQEAYVGARMGSYKPGLDELDSLLAALNLEAPGASTMYNAFARLKSSPQLSYLLEVGYWDSEFAFETMEIGANLTQASLILLYYPDLIREYLPLYLGIGGGITHVELTGSVLTLLSDVIKNSEDTGPSASFVIGLEYMIRERMMLNVQAHHIFKSIVVDNREDIKFSFDGTVISLGVSGRF